MYFNRSLHNSFIKLCNRNFQKLSNLLLCVFQNQQIAIYCVACVGLTKRAGMRGREWMIE